MREIITVQVGEAITNSRFVHVDEIGEAYHAVLPDRPATGFCRFGASDGLIQVFTSGKTGSPVEGVSGTIIYLDNDNAGQATTTKPDGIFQVLGRCVDGGDFEIGITQPNQSISPAASAFFL